MSSIPLTGQIRLGNNFNDQFFYGGNLTQQLNMNNELLRDYSIGGYIAGHALGTPDNIPFNSGVQRNLGLYRGGTGRCADIGTGSTTTAATSQTYALESGGGPASYTNYTKTSNPNLVGSADPASQNVIAQGTSGNTGGSNTAANIVFDIGYLEPGNYKVAFAGGHYNTGTHYCIIRGYTQPHLSGTSSNYYVRQKSCSWTGGWANGTLGTTGASFTVNSTYPYVIMSLETHVNTNYYLNTVISRKDTVGGYSDTDRYVNPNVWRVS